MRASVRLLSLAMLLFSSATPHCSVAEEAVTPESGLAPKVERLEAEVTKLKAKVAALEKQLQAIQPPDAVLPPGKIQRGAFAEMKSYLTDTLRQARGVPYFRDGEAVGVRFFALTPGSVYTQLGLKNGDVVLSVNDQAIAQPLDFMKALLANADAEAIVLSIERERKPLELKTIIVDPTL